MGLLAKWRMKRLIKVGELARIELQARCLHEWYYMGPEEVEYYNGIDTDWYTQHKLYCPQCDAEAEYITKESAEQAIAKSKLRLEARK